METAIRNISTYYPYVTVDEYVIMPDHVHLMLTVQREEERAVIVGQMKRWVSKQIGFSVWQKSYYEHIVRNEKEYVAIREYILNNPAELLLKNTPVVGKGD